MASIHEYISYEADNVGTPELFDTVMIRATIIQIDKVANTADIYTDEAKYWGRVDNVPIFYHCEGKETVSFGHQAFKDGDEVIVLCKNARRKSFIPELFVVGFPDKPKICSVDMCYIVGEIVSITGDYTDVEQTLNILDVNLNITPIITRPSDWIEWAVGDRVFAINWDNCECTKQCGDNTEYWRQANELLELTNAFRADEGLNPLVLNRKLTAAAQWMAEDQAANCLLGHDGSDGSTIQSRFQSEGYYPTAPGWTLTGGENGALGGDLETIFGLWLASSAHRPQLVNPDFREMGYGVSTISPSCATVTDTFNGVTLTRGVNYTATDRMFYHTFGVKTPEPWLVLPVQILAEDFE